MLESVDVYVLLAVACRAESPGWSQIGLSHDIGISPSSVNRALKKAEFLKLYEADRKAIHARKFINALEHGARYFLAPGAGGETRGMPTAWAAPPLVYEITSAEALPPVWSDPHGEVRGLAVAPLHPSAPTAARRDPDFYALLALVDVLRIGGARERNLADGEMKRRLLGKIAV